VPLDVVNWFLFRPTRAAQEWDPPPPGLVIQDVQLVAADGTSIHAWWSAPPGWSPVRGAVHYSHGNAGNLSMRGEGLRRWQENLGLAVLIFDYPGYGKSGGRPTGAGCLTAADAAYAWLSTVQQIPGERLVLYGGSLGGAVATTLAIRRPHRCLVLVSPFTSLRDMARLQFPWLPTRWLVGDRFDNLAKIGHTSRPVFIAHGTLDRLVPFSQGERLYAAAREPKEFFPMVGYDHHHSPGPEFYKALRRFLDRCDDGVANSSAVSFRDQHHD
jgi:fermentation-respiration switch protein FrsA (DUF1100 family)